MSLPGGSPGVPDQGILHSLPKESSKNPSQLQYASFQGLAIKILGRGSDTTQPLRYLFVSIGWSVEGVRPQLQGCRVGQDGVVSMTGEVCHGLLLSSPIGMV